MNPEPKIAALYDRARQVGISDGDLPIVPPPSRRLVALEGGRNFRDLGGYATEDGGCTRWGVLFRSDQLSELTDGDVDHLHSLGLRRVHDFRLESERERQPSRLPGDVEVLVLSAADGGTGEAMIDSAREMIAGERPPLPAAFWVQNYEGMVRGARPMFVALVNSLADDAGGGRLPALFHCTGGKDRTGVAALLVLRLVGVPLATAIDDYLLTNLYRTPARLAQYFASVDGFTLDPPAALGMLGVSRAAIERAASVIDEEFGGVEAYLRGGGLHPDAPERLRGFLVEAP